LIVASVGITLVRLTTNDIGIDASLFIIARVRCTGVVVITNNGDGSTTNFVIATVSPAFARVVTTVRVVGVNASCFNIERRSLTSIVFVTSNLNVDTSSIRMTIVICACIVVVAIHEFVLATIL